MTDVAEATAGNGLVAIDGKRKGQHVALRLPVTLIGTGGGCDVALSAPGVADLHCMIVLTPVGPALRSLFPAATRLNGVPTAAATLKHGDELAVGSSTFRFSWHGFTAPKLHDMPPRESAERPAQIQHLLDQLAHGREQLRTEKASIAEAMGVAKARFAEADEHAGKRRAELEAAKHERQEAAAERHAVEAERAAVLAERARVQAEMDHQAARAADAWAMIAAAQERHTADRAKAEQELSTLFRLLDERTHAEDAKFAARQAEHAERLSAFDGLKGEVAGLEHRAAHLRPIVEALEAQRPKPVAAPVSEDVPLNWNDDRSADQIIGELLLRERDLDRERRALAAVQRKLEAQLADLSDERLLLAEKRRAELETLDDLESLAHEYERREQALAEREAQDDFRKQRERDVWALQKQLEHWQAALVEREGRFFAGRDGVEAELSLRRTQILGREHDLLAVCKVWNAQRTHERESVEAELAAWRTDRGTLARHAGACDAAREAALADTARVATVAVAVEAARHELAATPKTERRLRVLQKRWESHFQRMGTDLAKRRRDFEAEVRKLDERYSDLHAMIVAATDNHAAANDERQQYELGKLTASPPAEFVPLTLARAVVDPELETIRADAAAMADKLLDADRAAGIFPLSCA